MAPFNRPCHELLNISREAEREGEGGGGFARGSFCVSAKKSSPYVCVFRRVVSTIQRDYLRARNGICWLCHVISIQRVKHHIRHTHTHIAQYCIKYINKYVTNKDCMAKHGPRHRSTPTLSRARSALTAPVRLLMFPIEIYASFVRHYTNTCTLT